MMHGQNKFALLLNHEIAAVITAMRKNDRWSVVQGRYYEQDRLEPDDFLDEFRSLRRKVFQWTDWTVVNPLEYLNPFLHVIRSPEVSGPITGVALTSVWNLLNHNIIGVNTVGAKEAMQQVVDDTTLCKFEATSSASDEVVLISILQVLLAAVKCDAAVFLTDALVCRAYQAAFMLGETKTKECSELLVHYSRQIVGEMTNVIFTRLSQLPAAVGSESSAALRLCEHGEEAAKEVLMFLADLLRDEDVEQGVDDLPVFALQMVHKLLLAAGPTLLHYHNVMDVVSKELFATMVDVVRNASLPIINGICQVILVMFQVLGQATLLQLETVVKKVLLPLADGRLTEGKSGSNDMSSEQQEAALEGLLDLTRQTGFIHTLFLNCDCRVDRSNLFEDICSLVSKTAFPAASSTGLTTHHLISLEAILAILSALNQGASGEALQLPASLQLPKVLDLWRSLVEGKHPDLSAITPQILGGALHPKDGQEGTVAAEIDEASLALLKAAAAEKILKTKVMLAADHFNRDYKKGFQFLQENKLLPVLREHASSARTSDGSAPSLGVDEETLARAVGSFLRTCPGIHKTTIGDLLGEPDAFYLRVLDAYSSTFKFKDMPFDAALRMFLESFKLPGEAQKIDRIVTSFGKYYHAATKGIFKHEDGPYILAYSVIMLNTDRHSNQVKKKMTFDDFRRNLRGQNAGEDFKEDFLLDIFNSIVRSAIRIHDTSNLAVSHATWLQLYDMAGTARGQLLPPSLCNGQMDCYMFQLIWGPAIHALTEALEKCDSSATMPVEVALDGLLTAAGIAHHYEVPNVVDQIVASLAKFNSGINPTGTRPLAAFGAAPRACLSTQAMFKIVTRHSDSVRNGWVNVMDLVVRLHKLDLLPVAVRQLFEEAEEEVAMALGEAQYPRDGNHPGRSGSGKSGQSGTGFSATSLIRSGITQVANLIIPVSVDNSAMAYQERQDEEHKEAGARVLESCRIEEVFEDSKFLRAESLEKFVGAMTRAGQQALGQDSSTAEVSLDLLLTVLLRNRDRLALLWPMVAEYLQLIISGVAAQNTVVEKAVVGVLRLCRRLLPYKSELAEPLLKGVQLATKMPPTPAWELAERIAAEMLALLKGAGQYIQHQWAWGPVCSLLQMTAVRPEAFPASLEAVLFCCEQGCLAPINFIPLLGAAFSMAEQAAAHHPDLLKQTLGLMEGLGMWVEGWGTQLPPEDEAAGPTHWSYQAKQEFWLALMDKLSGLAGLAPLEARTHAVAALQRAVVTAERIGVTAPYWERALGERVLPRLEELIGCVGRRQTPPVPEAHETVRELVRAVSKVVLLHLGELQQLTTFGALWRRLLSALVAAVKTGHEVLLESVPEALKNMLLVMHSKGVLVEGWTDVDGADLWELTWAASAQVSPNLTPKILIK